MRRGCAARPSYDPGPMAKGDRSEPTAKALHEDFPDLFHGVGTADLEFLAGMLAAERAAPGSSPIVQGETSEALLLVADGDLDVFLEAGGRSILLGRVGRGAYVGEMGLLDPGPATATVRATTECVLWRLTQPAWLQVAAFDARMARRLRGALVRTIETRLRASTESLPGAPAAKKRGGRGLGEVLGALFGFGKGGRP